MSEHVTIKVTDRARAGLKHISVQTGEKQYALVSRLVAQEQQRLSDLEQASRFPPMKRNDRGRWALQFKRKPGPKSTGPRKREVKR